MLAVTYMPVLTILRELYQKPRTMARFRDYLALLTGGTNDVVLPIGIANPMAKQQAVARLDELIALGADEIGAAAAAEAARRLAAVDLAVEIKAALVLADDVGGGWTNRYTTEAMVRFPGRGALRRPFATALVWTSASSTAEQLREEVLAAIYRVAHQHRYGLPRSLRDMLTQEGRAGVFSGAAQTLQPRELEAARAIIASVGDEPAYPTAFACLYGDDAAQQLGYAPLGLPARAGFEVALAEARTAAADPVGALLG